MPGGSAMSKQMFLGPDSVLDGMHEKLRQPSDLLSMLFLECICSRCTSVLGKFSSSTKRGVIFCVWIILLA